MKKLEITITTKKGKVKTVAVYVDDETAKALDQLNDEEYRQQYRYEEYLMQERDKWHRRKTVSLDAIIEKGDEPCSDKDLLDEIIKTDEQKEELHKAIEKLEPQQQEIVNLNYFEGKTQKQIARIFGIGETAVNNRLKSIYARLRKYLENF